MSWHYLRAQAEVFWEGCCLAGAPSALLKLIPTAVVCCSRGNTIIRYRGFRSGMTCKHSTANRGEVKSTSYRAASRVKISRSQEAVKDSRACARACGENMRESLARLDLDLCLPKIHRCFGRADSLRSCKILPFWGMMQNGACWELAISKPRTPETEYGCLLLTPKASDADRRINLKTEINRQSPELAALILGSKQQIKSKANRHRSKMAKRILAQLNLPVIRWPKKRPIRELYTQVGGPWIALREWLMGWPIGWSACEPLETDKFLQWQHLLGKPSVDLHVGTNYARQVDFTSQS
jgi:hypothetical protein